MLLQIGLSVSSDCPSLLIHQLLSYLAHLSFKILNRCITIFLICNRQLYKLIQSVLQLWSSVLLRKIIVVILIHTLSIRWSCVLPPPLAIIHIFLSLKTNIALVYPMPLLISQIVHLFIWRTITNGMVSIANLIKNNPLSFNFMHFFELLWKLGQLLCQFFHCLSKQSILSQDYVVCSQFYNSSFSLWGTSIILALMVIECDSFDDSWSITIFTVFSSLIRQEAKNHGILCSHYVTFQVSFYFCKLIKHFINF